MRRALGQALGALRASPLLAVGVALVALFALAGLLAPWVAPYDPRAITGDTFEPPSADHLLGTNDAGADILSRLVWGSRTTLKVAVAAPALALAVALVVGLTAGLLGGLVDTVLMRVVDLFLALPVVPLLIFVAALAGPSLTLSILLIGLTIWPHPARVVRSQTLSLRRRGFIDCARGFGAGPLYVMRRHLVPALGPVIAANALVMASVAVSIQAGLAFLGLGDPSEVSWGAEISRAAGNAQISIGNLWAWWLLPAGLALTLALFGFTFIGVALEPRFNPRAGRAG